MRKISLALSIAAVCAMQACGSPEQRAAGATDTMQTDVSGVNPGTEGNEKSEGDDARSSGETAPGDLTHKSSADDDSAYFMKEAAAGGLMEVEMGKIAAQRASNASVKAFALQMVADHSKANNELAAIARKAGIILPTAFPSEQKAHLDEMKKLSGAAFDKHYMDMMVTDHQKTIALFQSGQRVNKEDLVDFAQKTIKVIEGHAEKAKRIQSELR